MTTIINLSREGQEPQDGDFIRIEYENGASEEKHYWAPVHAPEVSATRKSAILSRLLEIDQQSTKPRTLRELQLNKQETRAWLQRLDDEAAALRSELKNIDPSQPEQAPNLGGGGGPIEPG